MRDATLDVDVADDVPLLLMRGMLRGDVGRMRAQVDAAWSALRARHGEDVVVTCVVATRYPSFRVPDAQLRYVLAHVKAYEAALGDILFVDLPPPMRPAFHAVARALPAELRRRVVAVADDAELARRTSPAAAAAARAAIAREADGGEAGEGVVAEEEACDEALRLDARKRGGARGGARAGRPSRSWWAARARRGGVLVVRAGGRRPAAQPDLPAARRGAARSTTRGARWACA